MFGEAWRTNLGTWLLVSVRASGRVFFFFAHPVLLVHFGFVEDYKSWRFHGVVVIFLSGVYISVLVESRVL